MHELIETRTRGGERAGPCIGWVVRGEHDDRDRFGVDLCICTEEESANEAVCVCVLCMRVHVCECDTY